MTCTSESFFDTSRAVILRSNGTLIPVGSSRSSASLLSVSWDASASFRHIYLRNDIWGKLAEAYSHVFLVDTSIGAHDPLHAVAYRVSYACNATRNGCPELCLEKHPSQGGYHRLERAPLPREGISPGLELAVHHRRNLLHDVLFASCSVCPTHTTSTVIFFHHRATLARFFIYTLNLLLQIFHSFVFLLSVRVLFKEKTCGGYRGPAWKHWHFPLSLSFFSLE